MRYGGHQTFFIREGWLHKGVDLLIHNPEKLSDPYAADYLGVGRNMAIAINHWLLATGLAQKVDKKDKAKTAKLTHTELASILWEKDPYFIEESTWWILHINLVNNPDYAATWDWFFHDYLKDRFEKPVALSELKRWEQVRKGNTPSDTTLDRDILVFLSSYSQQVPRAQKDPEEEIDCPLRDLGLMTHFKSSGYYQLHRIRRSINPGVLVFLLNLALKEDFLPTDKRVDIKLTDILRCNLSPTKVFVLTNEDLYDLLLEAERVSRGTLIKCQGLAGDRQISFNLYSEPLNHIKDHVYEKRKEATA